MVWISSCSSLRYLCLCGWFFCTLSSPWHRGLFWVIVSSLALTDCTAPVTDSSRTCTLEFTVLKNWGKLYVYHIQLGEEITPLNSLYQAVSARKTFSMLEMFTSPQAEIINGRLQLLHVSMSTPWWSTSCWCSSLSLYIYTYIFFLSVLWVKFDFWLEKQKKWKGTSRVFWPRCHPPVTSTWVLCRRVIKASVRMQAGH